MACGWAFGRASTLKSRADSGADVCLLPSEAPSTCGVATRTPGGQRSRGEVRYLLSQNQLMICSRNCEEKFYFLKVEGLFSSGWSRYGLRRRQFFARHPEPEFPESLLCRLHVFRVSGAKSAIVSVIGDMAGFTSAVVGNGAVEWSRFSSPFSRLSFAFVFGLSVRISNCLEIQS